MDYRIICAFQSYTVQDQYSKAKFQGVVEFPWKTLGGFASGNLRVFFISKKRMTSGLCKSELRGGLSEITTLPFLSCEGLGKGSLLVFTRCFAI